MQAGQRSPAQPVWHLHPANQLSDRPTRYRTVATYAYSGARRATDRTTGRRHGLGLEGAQSSACGKPSAARVERGGQAESCFGRGVRGVIMTGYRVSLLMGLAVGAAYGLAQVRPPAPP